MSAQDFEQVGRVVTERKALNEEIDEIKRQLAIHASNLRELASNLGSSPERVVFTGQSTTLRFQGSNRPIFNLPDDLIRTIKESVNILRERQEKLAEIERKAQILGI